MVGHKDETNNTTTQIRHCFILWALMWTKTSRYSCCYLWENFIEPMAVSEKMDWFQNKILIIKKNDENRGPHLVVKQNVTSTFLLNSLFVYLICICFASKKTNENKTRESPPTWSLDASKWTSSDTKMYFFSVLNEYARLDLNSGNTTLPLPVPLPLTITLTLKTQKCFAWFSRWSPYNSPVMRLRCVMHTGECGFWSAIFQSSLLTAIWKGTLSPIKTAALLPQHLVSWYSKTSNVRFVRFVADNVNLSVSLCCLTLMLRGDSL